jgi:hypothetical protein
MSGQLEKIAASPVWVRVTPFAVFLVLTQIQVLSDGAGKYWIYLAKTLVAAWLLWQFRRQISEMRWAFGWEGIAAGVAGFVMWVGLDHLAPYLLVSPEMLRFGGEVDAAGTWNPFTQFGATAALAWSFFAVRLLGSSLVVPCLEEVFYRSLAYRWIIDQDFLKLPLNIVKPLPMLIACAVFAATHSEIVHAFLYALLMHWVVWRRNRLGDAMTAHAITNCLLACWVVFRPDWRYW